MGAIGNKKFQLASAVANAGTVVTSYPAPLVQADLLGTTGGSVAVDGNVWKQGTGAGTVAFTYGSSTITITNNSGVSWPAGADIFAGFGRVDINGSYNLTYPKKVQDKVADLETRVVALETA